MPLSPTQETFVRVCRTGADQWSAAFGEISGASAQQQQSPPVTRPQGLASLAGSWGIAMTEGEADDLLTSVFDQALTPDPKGDLMDRCAQDPAVYGAVQAIGFNGTMTLAEKGEALQQAAASWTPPVVLTETEARWFFVGPDTDPALADPNVVSFLFS